MEKTILNFHFDYLMPSLRLHGKSKFNGLYLGRKKNQSVHILPSGLIALLTKLGGGGTLLVPTVCAGKEHSQVISIRCEDATSLVDIEAVPLSGPGTSLGSCWADNTSDRWANLKIFKVVYFHAIERQKPKMRLGLRTDPMGTLCTLRMAPPSG